MSELYLQPTPVAQWHALVNDAEYRLSVVLDEDVESYLVFMLMRFTSRSELTSGIMAIEFLESLHQTGSHKQNVLQEVGDKCLLLAGFYPEITKKRNLKESYYIDLGQNAYYSLASVCQFNISDLYSELCKQFITIKEVLQVMKMLKKEH